MSCKSCAVLAASWILSYNAQPPPFSPSPLYNTCAFPSCLMNTENVPCGMFTPPTVNTYSVAFISK